MNIASEIDPGAVIPFPSAEEATMSEPQGMRGDYQLSRFNAVKHGILSRHVVLPHEDGQEFQTLLVALVEEHQPSGATEMHLVEELAGIIWRKRRVLMAEGAAINRGLRSVVMSSYDSPAPTAVPFERGLSDRGSDVQDLMTATPEEIAERQQEARRDLEATERVAAILRKGGANAYERALRGLLADSREWWQEYVEEGEYQPNAEGLAAFINDHLLPLCISIEKETQHHQAIKAQTLGEGLQVHRLENLTRYEAHLDRKLERTLAMLIKLKELRKARQLTHHMR